ncbi:hypothetical protein HETIRDRAFT_173205 [Heterobasidion irregulare TC 32-1]|uniref:Uncharacterized protein n=1 Tax=Heterobasidion irregulare (strain TC 32-1) TaxID=747525 RepID=W4K8X2_HETIT|nr:uncharacterized protein HETIRDRAFT_173205 [Heterobasidion irregulare TC 32-1]ETW81526.1 hypothetical protein HETIRDRAFT_173205 [Heterobasidion irregulare TC 32-1]
MRIVSGNEHWSRNQTTSIDAKMRKVLLTRVMCIYRTFLSPYWSILNRSLPTHFASCMPLWGI